MQMPNKVWRALVANGYRACRDCGTWFKPTTRANVRCPNCAAWYARHASAMHLGAATCPVCGRYTRDPSGMHPACLRATRGRLTVREARVGRHGKANPRPEP